MYGVHVYDKSRVRYVQSLTIRYWQTRESRKLDLMQPVEAITMIM